MPVVLKPEVWPQWLGEEPADEAHLKALLAPNPSDGMVCWPGQPACRQREEQRAGPGRADCFAITVRRCRIAAAHDTVRLLPASGALKPMPEAQIVQAVQLLDLMLEHFADDGHWTRGRYDDGNGGHCLVGALLHLSRKRRLSRARAIALLQDAMPRPGLPLVHFNDTCCSSVAELRSIILKARRLADDHAEQGAGGRRGKGLAARPD